jgi:drug/metabolite transporter (DMT)-like permease
VGAILTFFAGLARVGPSAAAILSVFEPVVTVALAAAAFGESLAPVQFAGGALVLAAVVVMQWPVRRASPRLCDAPAPA